MIDFLKLLACALTTPFWSRARLEAEILVLRHQLNVLRRKAPKRLAFSSIDRLVFAGLYRLAPGVLDASAAGGKGQSARSITVRVKVYPFNAEITDAPKADFTWRLQRFTTHRPKLEE